MLWAARYPVKRWKSLVTAGCCCSQEQNCVLEPSKSLLLKQISEGVVGKQCYHTLSLQNESCWEPLTMWPEKPVPA